MILEMQISSLLSKISMEENEEKNKELDEKYKLKLKELKSLNKKIKINYINRRFKNEIWP